MAIHSTDLSWTTIVPMGASRASVKGTVLAVASVDDVSRFRVYEVRTLDADGELDILYRVHDADQVTDAQMRDGQYAPAVFWGPSLDAALTYMNPLIDADRVWYDDPSFGVDETYTDADADAMFA